MIAGDESTSEKVGDLLKIEHVTFERPSGCQVGKRIYKCEAEEKGLSWRYSLEVNNV